jgi:glyoxylase-like metal-dependent hydrolase (beta-lactamase superfamily II)
MPDTPQRTCRRLAHTAWGLAFLGIASVASQARAQETPDNIVRLGKDLHVQRLRTGFWVHVSQDTLSVPANGMIARTKEGLLLVDTTWSDDLAERLISWAEQNLADRVVKAVVTHSHADRTGGLAALKKRNIPVVALDLTIATLKAQTGKPVPELLMAATPGKVYTDPSGFEVFYPGPGHAKDNLVVWFPKQRFLFGGCLVRGESAQDLGNVADADLESWPKAIARVKERYGSAMVVVPGHGAVGGPAALTHTEELLRNRPR